eukprot:241057_1
MTQTYPVCHGAVLSLAHQFLVLKRAHGSSIEKALYKDMTLIEFFDRIATKRAVVFYLQYDSWMLRNGIKGSSGWHRVGTDIEALDAQGGNTPVLSEYMSYDELLLSALCGISSPTHWINKGDRHNHGKPNKNNAAYPMQGIYLGLIGARFEKLYSMEYQLMVITKEQNTLERGYGKYDKHKQEDLDRVQKAMNDAYLLSQVEASKTTFKDKPIIRTLFESFYSKQYFPLWEEVDSVWQKKDKIDDGDEYNKVVNSWYCAGRGAGCKFFDKLMFRRRMRVSLELFLFDCDARAKQRGKKAFCHVVGLGSGFWSFNKEVQDKEMVRVVLEIIRDSVLLNVACIYFSWFDENAMKDEDNRIFVDEDDEGAYCEYDTTGNLVYIQFGRREPADKLKGGTFEDCLLCACYAWDSNALPGNEYYLGKQYLNASGDPAAAACSTIPYVQNSMINKEYVSGANTMFYFFDGKSGTYEGIKLKDIDFEKNKEKWLKRSVLSIPYKRDTLRVNAKAKKNDDNEEKMNSAL